MRKLFRKLLILGFPFLILLSVPGLVLFSSRELVSFKTITRIHNSNEDLLIGPAYSNPDKYMKLNSTLERKPKVLALGSSRIMQVRSRFFKDSTQFYNAGGGIEKIRQFNFFINKLKTEDQPEILIIGLDQYFFNSSFDDLSQKNFESDYKDNSSPLSYLFDNCFSIWGRVIKNKISVFGIFERNDKSVGLNAILNENGFNHDGSYYYGTRYTHPEEFIDYGFKDTYQRIQTGVKRFQYGTQVNENAIASLNEFLKNCKERKIHVIAFLPPYAPSIVHKMRGLESKYSYIDKIGTRCRPYFADKDFKILDFTDMSFLGMSDENYIDGFHGSDKVYLRILMELAKADEKLSAYCDQRYLDSLYSHSRSQLQVF